MAAAQKKRRREISKNRIPIKYRPNIVTARSRVGYLEGDTVVGCGQSGNIVTLVDRKSLYLWSALCPAKHSQVVTRAIVRILAKVSSQHLHTITFDNGTKFPGHMQIAKELSVDIYFARPYCSNDRARNENTNGLLRQYFPKEFRFDTITPDQLQRVVEELNNRPRKTLATEHLPKSSINQGLRFEFEPAPKALFRNIVV
ncbi:MAG: IS30 family transposase [Candidatus Hydrogenedentes bacterium]|nr:IS30 family transposase [Candidatus Hydrogenedentota bacterium]